MGGIWEMIMELGLQVTGNMWDDPWALQVLIPQIWVVQDDGLCDNLCSGQLTVPGRRSDQKVAPGFNPGDSEHPSCLREGLEASLPLIPSPGT